MATLERIEKSTNDVFLAADDGSYIYDDNDGTYLMVLIGNVLENIGKNIATLEKIGKIATGSLEKISKNAGMSYFLRLLEPLYLKTPRITEDGLKRLLEDTLQDISGNISKNAATLTKIPKS